VHHVRGLFVSSTVTRGARMSPESRPTSAASSSCGVRPAASRRRPEHADASVGSHRDFAQDVAVEVGARPKSSVMTSPGTMRYSGTVLQSSATESAALSARATGAGVLGFFSAERGTGAQQRNQHKKNWKPFESRIAPEDGTQSSNPMKTPCRRGTPERA